MYEIILGRAKEKREKYGLNGTIFIGKQYVQMGQFLSMASPIYLDVASPHVVLVAGKRGSGKSYSLGVIAEGLFNLPENIAKNLSCLIFDTMGIFWTMKYPNYRDDELLQKWDLKASKLHPVVYVPSGLYEEYEKRGVEVDEAFAIKPQDVGAQAWSEIFNIDLTKDEGLLLERALASLEGTNFSIAQLLKTISDDKKSDDRTKTILENRFSSAQSWGIFETKGTKLDDLFRGGQTTVLDLSAYSQIEGGDRIKALVIKLICETILKSRLLARKEEEVKLIESGAYLREASTGEKAPLIWMLIDEGHDYIPAGEKTLASDALIQVLREGRQPGISLVIATQQPGSVAPDLLTQADVVISHRLTAKIDVGALSDVMQSYLPFKLQRYIDGLPGDKGAAIVLDDKLEKIYPFQVRPRASWHGGSDPSALPKEQGKSK